MLAVRHAPKEQLFHYSPDYMCNVQILSFLWYVHGCLKDLAYLFKCSNFSVEENAMAWVIWVSQGCVDFKPVVHRTEGTSGQKPI